MKQKSSKKLVLSKETVTNLNPNELKIIKGGTINSACGCISHDCRPH